MGRISLGLAALGLGLSWLASASVVGAAAPQLTATLSGDFFSTTLNWTGEPGPSGYFLIERSITGSEAAPRNYEGIADLKVSDGGPFEYRDTTPRAVWNCYRIRAKADNVEYSNEACVARPVVDGPRAPDVGNSPGVATPGFPYRWEFTVGGIILLVVGLVNWWAFRGYR